MEARPQNAGMGVLVGLGAFIAWGFVPLYWRCLDDVSADRIVSHRAIWCLVFMLIVMAVSQTNRTNLLNAIRTPRALWYSLLAGWLIGINWFIFIWAVNHGRVLQASLGYYLSPLVTVSLGALILREHLPRLRWIAIGIAALGVLTKVVTVGGFPWVALSLCSTWGCYALIKRLAGVDTITGLVIESASLLPPALVILVTGFGMTPGPGLAEGWPRVPLLLVGGGIVTAVPLLGYAFAARRLTLASLGLMQYLTPSMTFLLGLFLYHEPFATSDFFMFACIWLGLALYSYAGLRGHVASEP